MTRLLLPRGYKNAELLHQKLHDLPEAVWQKNGQRRALDLFHSMARRVPAYKDFLKSHNFSAGKVTSLSDFNKIPPIDKDNYLRKYPQEMLCWDGELKYGRWVISATSGSSGKPYYFPRERSQDWQYAITAELYLRNNFQAHNKSTLYIVAFPMGVWIGGLYTYEALKIVADNGGYNLSIITPGIHKQEVINAVLQYGGSFDQIIIGAYAPFLKDILDDGARAGINWKELDVGFIFSAEAFTEKFRDYVLQTVSPKNDLLATLNHYGTVDLGTMAHETPESILIRRELVGRKLLDLFMPEKVRQPTIAQYNPEMFYFEAEADGLLCSAYSGLPLVRYDLKDYGGIINRAEIHEHLKEAGINITDLIEKNNISETTVNLPFVYVYERNDFSVSYYSFLLYPDMVRRVLQADELSRLLTGKFTLQVNYSEEGRQLLNINIELKHSIEPNDELSGQLKTVIHKTLVDESSEYRETVKMVGDEAQPIIKLWKYEDQKYFRPGVKQKWVKK